MIQVSVIIPTYNRSALLKQAIESVLAVQNDDIALEILVVDDGSRDETAEVVKTYPVVYLRQAGGLGPARARNVGLEAAQGDYIAFLDDDDVWLPVNLTTQLRVFKDHPEYVMVFAQMWMTDSSLAARIGPNPSGTQPPQWGTMDLLHFVPQVGTCVARREVAQTMGFDASLRWGEDWDWVLSVAQRYPVGYVNVPVLLYRRQSPEIAIPQWRMVQDTLKVFHRHARVLSFSSRLRLKPVLWARRGWFAWLFMEQAIENARCRAYLHSAKAMWYALRASPPHVAVLLARSAWIKLARAH